MPRPLALAASLLLALPCLAADPALRLRSVTLVPGAPAPAVRADLAAPPLEQGGPALVLFRDDTTPAQRRAAVEAVGGTWGAYVPDGGAMVLLPPGAAARLHSAPEVALVAPYAPAWKLDPALAGPDEARDLLVSLHPWADPHAAASLVQAAGASLAEPPDARLAGPTLRVRSPARAAAGAIARLPAVRWIEPVPAYELANDRSRWILQSNVPGSFSIHDRGLRGEGQVVAMMDTGADKRHCCFAGRRIATYQNYGNGDRSDDHGHGTHVLGTVGCVEPGGVYDGLATGASFVVQDIGGAAGLLSPPSDLRTAYADAYQAGARVHTNSWGSIGNSYITAAQQIDDFSWTHPDFLILFAAGNNGGGANAGSLMGHATAKNIVTVGGTVSSPSQESLYGSTSKGPAPGGRRKPEVTAPATGSPAVTSAQTGSTCGFVGMSGTSMATPAVAGSAALVRQYFVGGFYPTGQAVAADGFVPSSALIKATLVAGADDMQADVTGHRPNNSQGWGRVHLDNALPFPGDPERLVVVDDRDTQTGFTAAGQEHAFPVFVSDPAQPLAAVLVWTDPAAAPGSIDALVNDLDLTLELHGGLHYVGGAGHVNGWAAPAGAAAADRVNNTEAIRIAAPQAGNATLRVRAFEVNDTPGRPQDYALVLVGGVSGTPCTAPAPPGLGDTLSVERTAGGVRLAWADPGADHAHVWRSSSPAGVGPGSGTPLAAEGVEGSSWEDPGALAQGSLYYLVEAANACHDEAP